MKIGDIDGVFTITLDLIATTTLAGMLLILGSFIKSKIAILERFCFPTPVIGGFIFSILALIFHITGTVTFAMDTTLQTPFMILFFTTVGLGGSFGLIKKGGKALIFYLLICWSLAIIQNGVGAGLALVLDQNPIIGIMAGSVSLEGGHGAAATFGELAERAVSEGGFGVVGAKAAAMASATFGLISGSLLGGPLARFLINKNKLKIQTTTDGFDKDYEKESAAQKSKEIVDGQEFLRTGALMGVIMTLGALLTAFVTSLGQATFSLPGYVGAMIVAMVFRNINDKTKTVKLNTSVIDIISDISIGVFLTMAMMSLKIWELASLAAPLIVILVVQVLILIAITVFIVFPVLGKDYDAAVICSGIMGHGLGATPNAVANMNSVCEHYKLRSEKAFLIVPLCGAVLVDLVGIPCITIFMNIFR